MKRSSKPPQTELQVSLLGSWRTNNRVMMDLIVRLPGELWDVAAPGIPQRTIRAIAAHVHNARCSWVKTLGREHGISTPVRMDHYRVTPRRVVTALKRSSAAMESLLKLGFASQNQIPPSKGYVWRNLSLDVGHVLTYFIAHEAHHRGQIMMIARQTGHRLPKSVDAGLWQWKMPKN